MVVLMTSDDESKLLKSLRRRYEGVDEEVRKYWDRRIDEEYKRRNKKGSVADDPADYAKHRELGKQDIGDISYKEPWQRIVRNKLGISVPINTQYRCPVCGQMYALDMPPERCIFCGARSFLHLKRIVNLKR
jgi:rubrerythrin